MADFYIALRSRLVADSEVLALVGTRIYWNLVPQDALLPYIRMQTVSDTRPEHLKGYQSSRSPRVQVDCFASSYLVARALAEEVIAAVATPATVAGVNFGRVKAEGPRDLGEDIAGKFVHRTSLDLLVEHSLA